jgi:hypothetical protein
MERVKTCLPDQGQGVVLLEKQLTRSIESDAVVGEMALELLGFGNDQIHGLIPRGSLQTSISSDQGILQTVRAMDGLPTELSELKAPKQGEGMIKYLPM